MKDNRKLTDSLEKLLKMITPPKRFKTNVNINTIKVGDKVKARNDLEFSKVNLKISKGELGIVKEVNKTRHYVTVKWDKKPKQETHIYFLNFKPFGWEIDRV